MKYTTQNAKIAAITEKTLIIGIDVGSETHFARAFNWRGYEFSRKPLGFSNTEEGLDYYYVHIAVSNGRVCEANRPRCEANRSRCVVETAT